MNIKTSELDGVALGWAVAVAIGSEKIDINDEFKILTVDTGPEIHCNYSPSTDWSQGGQLIEAHEVCIDPSGSGTWAAKISGADWVESPSPLISACRAIVSEKLGDEVEVPDELL